MSSSGISNFKECYTSALNFYSKINKEPILRRENVDRINKLLVDVGLIEGQFNQLKLEFNKVDRDSDEVRSVRAYIVEIDKCLYNSRRILLDRLSKILENNSDDKDCNISVTMPEKFDLRTAASLLPPMDGTEDATNQLIDAIQLYNELLDADGKKLLITYVLKVKLSQSAKMRLDKTYTTVEMLLSDMKKHLLTKKSATALATELHSIKQEGKSIDDFAKNIEELFLNLTLAQADGKENSLTVLREVNEKLAIHAFSNGLKNNELRTVIKARNYSSLKDAISGAKDEERQNGANSVHNSYHMRMQNNSNRFNNRGRRSRFTSRGFSRPSFNNNQRQSATYTVNQTQRNVNNNSLRGQGRGPSRYRSNYRGYHNNYNRNSQRVYMADSTVSNSNVNTELGETEHERRFFRAEQ